MSNFWDRQLAKQKASEPQPMINSQPWWAQGSNLLNRAVTVPTTSTASEVPADTKNDGVRYIDGHDITKATVLQGRAFECPYCPVNPKTSIRGNMARPSPSMAIRCFDCGYIEDGRFDSPTRSMSAIAEGPSQRARQTASGGGVKNNFHGSADSGDIVVVGRIT